MEIGFTGTQKGMTEEQKRVVLDTLRQLKPFEVHHGDCIGADSEFHDISKELGFRVVIHPPLLQAKRAKRIGDEVRIQKPYLERNHDIVDESNLLIACPREFEEQLRSGTWTTVRYARKCERKILIVFPDGTVKKEGL